MRDRNVWATSLALGLGLCMVSIAVGQDPAGGGNWFTRLFTRGSNTASAHKDEKVPAIPALSPAVLRQQATTDFLRRLEVCDRLRAAALETGDTELASKADMLEHRAKDAYIQRINHTGGMVADVDEETLERKLAPKGASLTPLTAGTRTKSGTSQAALEGRP